MLVLALCLVIAYVVAIVIKLSFEVQLRNHTNILTALRVGIYVVLLTVP